MYLNFYIYTYILISWKLSGTSVISADLAFGDLMRWMSFIAIWIAGIYILGSHALKSFGDFQNFHAHLHILATDGCFYNDEAFMVCPPADTSELEKLLRYEVF